MTKEEDFKLLKIQVFLHHMLSVFLLSPPFLVLVLFLLIAFPMIIINTQQSCLLVFSWGIFSVFLLLFALFLLIFIYRLVFSKWTFTVTGVSRKWRNSFRELKVLPFFSPLFFSHILSCPYYSLTMLILVYIIISSFLSFSCTEHKKAVLVFLR